jgi:hypothetical protein
MAQHVDSLGRIALQAEMTQERVLANMIYIMDTQVVFYKSPAMIEKICPRFMAWTSMNAQKM